MPDRRADSRAGERIGDSRGPRVHHLGLVRDRRVAKSGELSPSRFMAEADLALYQAKDKPGTRFAVFEPWMEAPRRRRAEVERALQLPRLLANLRLVFQPIFDLGTGQIIAYEALARWNDPELGEVSPAEFVPLAEQLGLIDGINHHLMAKAFATARHWPEIVRLSFNLSAIQLCSPGSAELVLQALSTAGLDADRLQVEVTETALLADFERVRENLNKLKHAGATIVLDDFGAGYASIGYLRELRFDQIKLDGGLVTAAQHSEDGKRLLRSVIGLCEILGVSSVAEHIESAELLSLVLELGCAAGQGYWLAEPLSAEELAELCKQTSRTAFRCGPPELGPRSILKDFNPLHADRLNNASKLLDPLTEPGELFGGNAIMFGVAGLHVGVLELLEHRALFARFDRPDVGQPTVEPLGLRAQEAQIVDVRRVEGQTRRTQW